MSCDCRNIKSNLKDKNNFREVDNRIEKQIFVQVQLETQAKNLKFILMN